jgi:hypothetical protein
MRLRRHYVESGGNAALLSFSKAMAKICDAENARPYDGMRAGEGNHRSFDNALWRT